MSRSPNYPAIGLTKAVEFANKLWHSEKRSPFTTEAAALSFGFKSLSGPARTSVAALGQYGLVEKADKGNLRLSQLAIAIIAHPEGSPERREALLQAGQHPKLFKELLATYADASDTNIKAYLITKKEFSDEGAKKVIKSFRDTVRLAKLDGTSLNPQVDDDIIDGDEFETGDDTDSDKSGKKKKRRLAVKDEIVEELNFKLAPESNVSLVFTSKQAVTQEDFDLLMEMLTLQKRAFPKKSDLDAEPVDDPNDEIDEDLKEFFKNDSSN